MVYHRGGKLISQIGSFCDLSDDIPFPTNLAIRKRNHTYYGVVRVLGYVPGSNHHRGARNGEFT